MFTVQIDDSRLRARFDGMNAKVRAALLKKVSGLAVQLATLVRTKLSGQVLVVRSGALRASINENVVDSPDGVTGSVFSSGDVKYAAIHEYGGVIPAHDVIATKAQALAFVWQGKQQFFKRVRIPDVTMPERSYMRSSLSDMKDQIVQGLTDAVMEGMR